MIIALALLQAAASSGPGIAPAPVGPGIATSPAVEQAEAEAPTGPGIAPAVVTAEDAPLILWNSLAVGMSRADVRAHFPDRRITLSDGCIADVDGDFEDGQLRQVNLEPSGRSTADNCDQMVAAGLRHQYGEPVQSQQIVGEQRSCGNSYARGWQGALSALCEGLGGDQPDQYLIETWVNDGVQIHLRHDLTERDEWRLAYLPNGDPSAKEDVQDLEEQIEDMPL